MTARYEDLFLTIPQVGALLDVGTNRVYDLIREGKIPGFSIGRRKFVPRKEFEAWFEANRRPTPVE